MASPIMIAHRHIVLGVVLVVIGGSIVYLEQYTSSIPPSGPGEQIALSASSTAGHTPVRDLQQKEKRFSRAKEITTPDGFINTDALTLRGLIGKKVILLDFWTYSCINCQRTIPYLNAWYEKYADQGLVIIGVHTPEFAFEQKYENVERAVKKFGIRYPVVLDNDYSTWQAYRNRYWPRKYLIDIDGFVVYDHIGEGGYAETEQQIQKVLAERMAVLGIEGSIDPAVVARSVHAARLEDRDVSPEMYFGAARNAAFGNGQPGVEGTSTFVRPQDVVRDMFAFVGTWEIADEFAENTAGGARILLHYRAKRVFFVAGAAASVHVTILRDGKEVGRQVVEAHDLYRLVEDAEYAEHTLEILIEDPGLRAFTFTFG